MKIKLQVDFYKRGGKWYTGGAFTYEGPAPWEYGFASEVRKQAGENFLSGPSDHFHMVVDSLEEGVFAKELCVALVEGG